MAESQDQLVVGQFALLPGGIKVDHPAFQVDALDRGLDEAGGLQKGSDRERAMAHVEGSRKNLKEKRRHEQEVVPAHQNDFDIRAAFEKPLQAAGRVDSAKAAAEDQNAFLLCRNIHMIVPQSPDRHELGCHDSILPPFDR